MRSNHIAQLLGHWVHIHESISITNTFKYILVVHVYCNKFSYHYLLEHNWFNSDSAIKQRNWLIKFYDPRITASSRRTNCQSNKEYDCLNIYIYIWPPNSRSLLLLLLLKRQLDQLWLWKREHTTWRILPHAIGARLWGNNWHAMYTCYGGNWRPHRFMNEIEDAFTIHSMWYSNMHQVIFSIQGHAKYNNYLQSQKPCRDKSWNVATLHWHSGPQSLHGARVTNWCLNLPTFLRRCGHVNLRRCWPTWSLAKMHSRSSEIMQHNDLFSVYRGS